MVRRVDQGVPFKVLLVGVGEIGSRHLQGLARSTLNLSLEILEPSASARELAIRRFKEIPANETRKTLRAIDSLDSSAFQDVVDLAIIATDAASRYEATRNLLSTIKVPYLLLEKVLFQRLCHFDEMETLLSKNGCKAWVNCTRRTFPYARHLRELFSGDTVSISVQGGNWRLGSSGIHFLDLLAFLSGVSIPGKWNIDFLDDCLYESKRGGYKEFGGSVTFCLRGGHEIVMKDDKLSGAPFVIDIVGRRARAIVIESASLMLLWTEKNGWRMERHEILIPFQSELTNKVIEGILTRDTCDLTEYGESARLHKAYLEAFLEHMRKMTGDQQDVCPIT